LAVALPRRVDLLREGPCSKGKLELTRGPGLGIELDEDALADKLGHDWRNPESYDADDGSVVDW